MLKIKTARTSNRQTFEVVQQIIEEMTRQFEWFRALEPAEQFKLAYQIARDKSKEAREITYSFDGSDLIPILAFFLLLAICTH